MLLLLKISIRPGAILVARWDLYLGMDRPEPGDRLAHYSVQAGLYIPFALVANKAPSAKDQLVPRINTWLVSYQEEDTEN